MSPSPVWCLAGGCSLVVRWGLRGHLNTLVMHWELLDDGVAWLSICPWPERIGYHMADLAPIIIQHGNTNNTAHPAYLSTIKDCSLGQ